MKSTMYSLLNLIVIGLICATTGFVFAGDGGKGPDNGTTTQIRLRTNLAGAAIGAVKPGGNADFRMDGTRTRLDVEVENTGLPSGTVLTVVVTHAGIGVTAGMITVNSGRSPNELELDSQHGDAVPTIASGDMIAILNGAAVILAGAF